MLIWIIFAVFLLGLLGIEWWVFERTKAPKSTSKMVLTWSLFYMACGLGFSFWVHHTRGASAAQEYLAAFLVEKSLSLDNLFVISMIFTALSIPKHLQRFVLFCGFLGVIVFRALMIGAGGYIIHKASWVLHVFSVFLALSGLKMLFMASEPKPFDQSFLFRFLKTCFPITARYKGHALWVYHAAPDARGRRWHATPLFLAMIAIELSDILFALDSIPAVFSITQDLYVVYTSNVAALLGLRSLYGLLSYLMQRLPYLKQTLAVLLIFIGCKSLIAHLLDLDHFPMIWSLGGIGTILTTGFVLGMLKKPVESLLRKWRARRDSNS